MAYATYYPQVMASGAFLVQVDGNGNLGTYYNGTEIGFTTQAGAESINGALTVQSGQSASGSLTFIEWGTGPTKLIYGDGGTAVRLEAPGGAFLSYNNNAKTIGVNSTGIYSSTNTAWSVFGGINTAGPLGVGAIYGATSPTHKTNAAPASTTYASPAAGFYVIKVSMDVKTATTLTGKFKATYTDSEGTAQTDALVFVQEGTATAVTSITTADRFSCVYTICTSGATNIVVTDNSGTYTTCDYYYAVTITQEA